MLNRPHFIQADAQLSLTDAVEMYDVINNEHKISLFKEQAFSNNLTNDVRETILDAPKWLPFAAEKMNISPDIKDYILMPFPIMYSDLPNKNGVGFPHSELSSYCVDGGCLAYQTFKGKPTFVEHNNADWTKAKGVILSTSYRPLKKNIWRLTVLTAFDRKRDPILCNDILNKKRAAASMGAYASDYICSITGNTYSSGNAEQYTKLKRPSFQIVNGKVAYLQAVDPMGFETSIVATPAYDYCRTDQLMMI